MSRSEIKHPRNQPASKSDVFQYSLGALLFNQETGLLGAEAEG